MTMRKSLAVLALCFPAVAFACADGYVEDTNGNCVLDTGDSGCGTGDPTLGCGDLGSSGGTTGSSVAGSSSGDTSSGSSGTTGGGGGTTSSGSSIGSVMSSFWTVLRQGLLYIPQWCWQELLSAFASIITAIPVPTFFTTALQNAGSIPASIIWFLDIMSVKAGLGMVITAYTLRFLLRRIPFIG